MAIVTDTLVEKSTSTPEGMRLFQQEGLVLEVTERICEVMDEKGISRSNLAKKLGKTKGYITQILSGHTNLTLRTTADVFTALGVAGKVTTIPIEQTIGRGTKRGEVR